MSLETIFALSKEDFVQYMLSPCSRRDLVGEDIRSKEPSLIERLGMRYPDLLFEAWCRRSPEKFDALLYHFANPFAPCRDGMSPFYQFIVYGDIDTLKKNPP